MEYNTTRSMMILPEYGRNVQNMISHAKELADREERNRAAQAIIEVMGQLNPHLRDVDDYRHKLWTHLFVMSNFELDVDSPYEIPKLEVLNQKPDRMVYPKSKIRYGHYGQYTERILSESKNLTNEDEKNYLKKSMGDFMKTQFLTFNNDAVENSLIATQMAELSKGVLVLENPEELIPTNTVLKNLGRISNNPKSNNRKSKPKKKRN